MIKEINNYIPQRTYTILSVICDGGDLLSLAETAKQFCTTVNEILFAYIQNNEVNMLLVDFDPTGKKESLSSWCDGNAHKMIATVSSKFTFFYSQLSQEQPTFACKVLNMMEPFEAYSYMKSRQVGKKNQRFMQRKDKWQIESKVPDFKTIHGDLWLIERIPPFMGKTKATHVPVKGNLMLNNKDNF